MLGVTFSCSLRTSSPQAASNFPAPRRQLTTCSGCRDYLRAGGHAASAGRRDQGSSSDIFAFTSRGRGFTLEEIRANLQAILDKVKTKNPGAAAESRLRVAVSSMPKEFLRTRYAYPSP